MKKSCRDFATKLLLGHHIAIGNLYLELGGISDCKGSLFLLSYDYTVSIWLVSQKCSNFSVTIIMFLLDSTLRQWETAVLRTNIAAYQQRKQGGQNSSRDCHCPESQDSNLHKGSGQCTVWRLLPFS